MTDRRQSQILAIDDDADILEVVKTCLEAEGFQVHTSNSPEEGLRIYELLYRDIDLVILDYLMPGMTGDSVFEWMQRINPDVKAILLTAADNNAARVMLEHGVRAMIEKPFSLDDLILHVRNEIELG